MWWRLYAVVPEAAVAMLYCARIGAVHSGDLRGLLAGSVAGRIITTPARGGDHHLTKCTCRTQYPAERMSMTLKNPNVTSVEHVIVLKRTGSDIDTAQKTATCGRFD